MDDQETQGGGGPFSRWFSWAHILVTVGLCALLLDFWGKWRDDSDKANAERLRLEARIVVLETDSRHQSDTERNQTGAIGRELEQLSRRIDAQRDDIRSLQNMLSRHMDYSPPAPRQR